MNKLQSLLMGTASVAELTVGGRVPEGIYTMQLGKAEYKLDKNNAQYLSFAAVLTNGVDKYDTIYNVFNKTVFVYECRIKGLNITEAEDAAGLSITNVTVAINDKGFNIISVTEAYPKTLGEYKAVFNGVIIDADNGVGIIAFSINGKEYYDIRIAQEDEDVKKLASRLSGLALQFNMVKDAKFQVPDFDKHIGDEFIMTVTGNDKYKMFSVYNKITAVVSNNEATNNADQIIERL